MQSNEQQQQQQRSSTTASTDVRIAQMHSDLKQTTEILGSAMEHLVKRGELLEDVAERSEQLSMQSRQFYQHVQSYTQTFLQRMAQFIVFAFRWVTCNHICCDVYQVLREPLPARGTRRNALDVRRRRRRRQDELHRRRREFQEKAARNEEHRGDANNLASLLQHSEGGDQQV